MLIPSDNVSSVKPNYIVEAQDRPSVVPTSEVESKDGRALYTDADACDIARVLYDECRGVPSRTEQACVAWVILNRADKTGMSIHDIIREPSQFSFSEDTQIDIDLYILAYDVLLRWGLEHNGEADVGRVLPKEFLFFSGDGDRNHFRNHYEYPFDVWDYSLESPYSS